MCTSGIEALDTHGGHWIVFLLTRHALTCDTIVGDFRLEDAALHRLLQSTSTHGAALFSTDCGRRLLPDAPLNALKDDF